jgi:hypothetical protein
VLLLPVLLVLNDRYAFRNLNFFASCETKNLLQQYGSVLVNESKQLISTLILGVFFSNIDAYAIAEWQYSLARVVPRASDSILG